MTNKPNTKRSTKTTSKKVTQEKRTYIYETLAATTILIGLARFSPKDSLRFYVFGSLAMIAGLVLFSLLFVRRRNTFWGVVLGMIAYILGVLAVLIVVPLVPIAIFGEEFFDFINTHNGWAAAGALILLLVACLAPYIAFKRILNFFEAKTKKQTRK